MRLVLDTNIVMDMLHFGNQHARPLQTALAAGQIRCFTDSHCLAELESVVSYPEFGLDRLARNGLIRSYRRWVTLCDAAGVEDIQLPVCRDPDDQKFLILAARCQADLLVTRDKLLLELARHRKAPPPCPIVTADAACRLLQLSPEHPAGFV